MPSNTLSFHLPDKNLWGDVGLQGGLRKEGQTPHAWTVISMRETRKGWEFLEERYVKMSRRKR